MRQYLRERLDQLTRERASLAVIMLDLDGFKQINDTYGHLDGDLILKRLAELILASLPANAYAIRFAGDEFFAFLEGIDASEGVRVAEAIRERVNTDPFATDKAPDGIQVRISLGVAAYPEDAPSPPNPGPARWGGGGPGSGGAAQHPLPRNGRSPVPPLRADSPPALPRRSPVRGRGEPRGPLPPAGSG